MKKEIVICNQVSRELFSCKRGNDMEEKKDVLLAREVYMAKPYQFRKGTKESGCTWSKVAMRANTNEFL